jgi:hypothetical protein
MKRSILTLEMIYISVKYLLSRIRNEERKKRGRPRKYQDEVILTLSLFQTYNELSFREVLEIAKREGFEVPSLNDYHYRFVALKEELMITLNEESCEAVISISNQKGWSIKLYIVGGTGFSFGDKYRLSWMRGTEVRNVKSHVRLVVVVVANDRGNAVIMSCEAGGPYASEVEMLRKILRRVRRLENVPFLADRGYDAVDVIRRVLELGGVPSIKIKETFRKSVRHPLRKLSRENWERYGRGRYRVESVFGSMKQKLGSGFRVVREDVAKKMAIACALLWNIYMLWVLLFLSFLPHLKTKSIHLNIFGTASAQGDIKFCF